MKRSAVGAVAAQGAQALASFVLQITVAHTLGIGGLGAFSILYGVVVLASGTVTGFVGDSLVVLDRRARPIRSALEQYALLLAIGSGAVAAAVTTAVHLTSASEGVLFALAIAAFCLEEVVRRTLMAELLFWRVVVIDSAGLVVTMGLVGIAVLRGSVSLGDFLGALAIGQTGALLLGFVVVRREDRFLVPFVGGGRGAVAAYGVWRSLQQFLRPALLTAVRVGVGIVAGLAATGLLEAARVYVAPALLLVSGLSSFLFASFARQRDLDPRTRLRRADRAVLALLVLTVAIGAIAVVLLPLVGRTLFSASPDIRAVVGWLAYTASVAAVTPYGALAAVSGGQAAVFLVRLADTTVSLAAVLVGLALGMDPAWSAALLAVGSIAGGLVLRQRSAGRLRGAGVRRRTVVIGAAAAIVLVAAGVGSAFAVHGGRTTSSSTSPPATSSAAEVVLSVVGDDTGAAPDAAGRRWPGSLSPAPSRTLVLGGRGDGYTAPHGASFARLATRVDPRSTVVVLFGGTNDRGASSLRILEAVSSAVRAARKAAPDARIVLVGPATPRVDGESLARVRSTLGESAASLHVRFVDPVESHWFVDGRGLAADGRTLDAAGEQTVATELGPLITS